MNHALYLHGSNSLGFLLVHMSCLIKRRQLLDQEAGAHNCWMVSARFSHKVRELLRVMHACSPNKREMACSYGMVHTYIVAHTALVECISHFIKIQHA